MCLFVCLRVVSVDLIGYFLFVLFACVLAWDRWCETKRILKKGVNTYFQECIAGEKIKERKRDIQKNMKRIKRIESKLQNEVFKSLQQIELTSLIFYYKLDVSAPNTILIFHQLLTNQHHFFLPVPSVIKWECPHRRPRER